MRGITIGQSIRSSRAGRFRVYSATSVRLQAIHGGGAQDPTTDDSRARTDTSVSKVIVNLELGANRKGQFKRWLKMLVIVCRLFILLSPSFTTEAGSGKTQTWIYDVNMVCSIVVFIKIALVLRKKSRLIVIKEDFTFEESGLASIFWQSAASFCPLQFITSTLS